MLLQRWRPSGKRVRERQDHLRALLEHFESLQHLNCCRNGVHSWSPASSTAIERQPSTWNYQVEVWRGGLPTFAAEIERPEMLGATHPSTCLEAQLRQRQQDYHPLFHPLSEYRRALQRPLAVSLAQHPPEVRGLPPGHCLSRAKLRP